MWAATAITISGQLAYAAILLGDKHDTAGVALPALLMLAGPISGAVSVVLSKLNGPAKPPPPPVESRRSSPSHHSEDVV